MTMFHPSMAVVALLFSAGSNAFVVPSTSTFVQRTDIILDKARAFAPKPPRALRTKSDMSMNLFDRFARVAKANLNNVLKNLESPEKIMNQAVEDMQSDLVKIRQTCAEVTANERRLLSKKKQAEASAMDWYNRAQLALCRGKDDLARDALVRRQQYVDTAKDIQAQIDVQSTSLDKLYEGMKALEVKLLDVKSKKEQYVARAKTAKSVTKVNDMLGGLTGKTSMDAFCRMEEKVEALEAAAEASTEMSALNGFLLPGSEASKLEQEFALLEGSAAVDEELKKMKKLLRESPKTAAPVAKSSKAIEYELANMKRSIKL